VTGNEFPDIVLAGDEGFQLLEGGPAGWENITPEMGLPTSVVTGGFWQRPDIWAGSYAGVWPFDLELDGDLDLILGAPEAPLVARNNGDGTWGIVEPFEEVRGLTATVWGDVDGDGAPDLGIIDAEGLGLLINNREGRFQLHRVRTTTPAIAVSLADANDDGSLDVTALTADGTVVRVAHEGGVWSAAAVLEMDPQTPDSAPAALIWADLDNNGAVDAIAGGVAVLRGPDGEEARVDLPTSAVLSAADTNSDGLLDLVGLGAGNLVHLENKGGAQEYRWQAIQPRAAQVADGRINTFGVGGEVEARAGLLVTRRPIDGPSVHLGLGSNAAANVIRILWPNGTFQAEFELVAGQSALAEQRLKGSCPWLFAFDGEELTFVTDLLWRSPLGLRINGDTTAGVASTLDWVRIRGDQLAPVDGQYDLRITAELWETHFIDHVALIVVDHPPGTEAYVDEAFRFPPPATAVTLTGPAQPVTSATDDIGADVTSTVKELDGQYVAIPLGRYQGAATPHSLTLDLGSWETDPPRWLLAQGWIYPTDSSLNVAISQGSSPPSGGFGLSLEVPDEAGGWRVAREGLGFPAGKHKTMLIDLAGLAPKSGPFLVRLNSSEEIYWDRLAVASAAPHAEPQLTELSPSASTLRYRGYSYTNHSHGDAPRQSPEVPEYDRIAGTSQRWFELEGFYTRFGAVDPLLERIDDRYAILNSGDELLLRFDAPPPPPEGWLRDYVFVSDGWVKDGDYNTAHSKTVGPLPDHDHPEYTGEGLVGPIQTDPVFQMHRDDWLEFHTRYVPGQAVRRALLPREESGR
jgi:hypothetical protein